MELDRVALDLLRPAADRLRRALQKMDAQDVPPSLRPLAESSARRLPPPILRRALTELDRSDWLRAEVAAGEDLDEGTPEALFVLRPDGWEEQLELMVASMRQDRVDSRQSEAERRLSEALSRIEELESDLREGAVDVARAERRVRDRLRDQIAGAERSRQLAEQQAREEARVAARMSSRVERLQAELQAAERRIETLRQMLEKERRTPSVEPSARRSRGWFPDDPEEMAEELDRIRLAVRRPPAAYELPAVGGEPLRLPDGLRPDRAEAVRWLLGKTVRWLIDGYNVAYQVTDEPTGAVRARLVAAAGQISTLSPPGSMVVVVFDSSVDTSSLPASRRVRVVYVHSADNWILEQAAPGAVVVSSDREVREGAEEAGAIGLWSEALADWITEGP